MNYLILITFVLLTTACGEKGDKGDPGAQGNKGIPGVLGAPGPSGTPGSPGTVITPIQLCPASFVPTYPSTFPEYALCIDHSLYGVYSANGGFLALLPQGTYSSNGINASCTFTIAADCVVQ